MLAREALVEDFLLRDDGPVELVCLLMPTVYMHLAQKVRFPACGSAQHDLCFRKRFYLAQAACRIF
jgi:hypothetical protein